MDANPWGDDPSPSHSPSAAPLPLASPALSTSTESSTGPAWKEPVEEQEEEEAIEVEEEQQRVSESEGQPEVAQVAAAESLPKAVEEEDPEVEVEDEALAPPTPSDDGDGDDDKGPSDDVPPSPPSAPSSPPKPSAPTLSMTLPPMDQGPPMDDFSDDEQPATTAPANAAPDSFDDDFDDFGEAGTAGDDDDFGDFGDFGDADAGGEDEGFGGAGFVEEAAAAPPPVASTSRSGYEPLRLDLTNTSKAAMAAQLQGFLEGVYPGAADAVSDEPERQVEGAAQVLVNEPLRGLLSTLSSLPPLRPLDWRRSRIRREHLIALGVPINLDDSADSKPLASLVLPSQINTLATSSSIRSASPSGPRSATPPAGASFSPSTAYPPSRSSTPFADRERQRASALPPPLDRKRADAVCAIGADDLVLLSMQRLTELRDEIDALSNEASGVLTHALLMREKEVSDAETYNGMIQDLVMAAAKAKTTSGRGSATPTRSGSGRWGRNAVK